MINTSTNYLGIQLRNPVIVSSSGLSSSISTIEKLAQAGAGAIVLKSIFEEQIRMESGSMLKNSDYPEAEDYILNYSKLNAIDQYLKLIEDAKVRVDVPIIGSINCVSASDWTSFAQSMQDAGADAIELNVFFVPNNIQENRDEYENLYLKILTSVKKEISIPVAIKIGQNFSQLPAFVNSLYSRGANGVVLFNRFYAPDININNLSLTTSEVFSSPADIRDSLRWIGIISALIPNLDLCASTGVHDGAGVVKQILSGAKAVQVCSTLYKNGIEHLGKMIDELNEWMKLNNFSTISEFRGRLNYKNIPDPMIFERVQFMKYFSNME